MFLVRALAVVVIASEALQAQSPAGFVRRAESLAPAPKLTESNNTGAFAVEMLGGTVGSLVGIGIVALSAKCVGDDLGCEILWVGAGGALGAVGATVGTTLAARYTGAKRSVAGAAIGSIVGTGVGLGVHWLLNKNSDRNLGDPVVVPIFVISQGTVAALGSRLFGSSP